MDKMKKKNGFKPTEMEEDIQQTFSTILSTTPQNPQTVQHITERIRDIGKEMDEKRKRNERRLVTK